MTTPAYARMTRLLAEERRNDLSWWWCSFVGPEGFRGVVVVEARGMLSAVQWTHKLGVNPGGDVQIVSLKEPPAPEYRNRLLTRDECALADVVAG